MANSAGLTNKVATTPWTTDRKLELGCETVGSTTTFYDGQAVGRNANGNMVQMDDTAAAEFIGILISVVDNQVVNTTDVVGQTIFRVMQPQMFTANISGALPGDEGKRVYWLYNETLSYTPGTYGNFAGWVWEVLQATGSSTINQVTVVPPWMGRCFQGGRQGLITGAATGTTTLTKFDVNKDFALPITGSVTINLPVSTKCSPGDCIDFWKTGSGAFTISLATQGTDSINLGASSVQFNSDTIAFKVTHAETDGNGSWYVREF